MGFHKRWISEDKLRSTYESSGLPGLKMTVRADAFIIEDSFSSRFLDIFSESKTEEELQEKIKQHFECSSNL